MARKKVTVTSENSSRRNIKFHDNYNNKDMTRKQFVDEINKGDDGDYSNYHIRVINGIKTPASNPDSSTNNNLD